MHAQSIIRQLELQPLPHEGGWFCRIHTDSVKRFPERHTDSPALSSGIYFLLTPSDFSAMHRLSESVETFHWHAGDPVEMLLLYPDGSTETHILGPDLDTGQRPIAIVPRCVWQGSRLAQGWTQGFALLTVMVTPEFRWDDFQLGTRDSLSANFPDQRAAIKALTRG